jgi:hypothetical protein
MEISTIFSEFLGSLITPVKSGLPIVLGMLAGLTALGILLKYMYRHVSGGSAPSLGAPKGSHYTKFTKRNGEQTYYLFDD